MSLEKILDCIRAEGEAQAAEIRQQAESEIIAAQAKARQEAEQIYADACREAQQDAEGECARLLNTARFEANCLLGEAREQFITSVLDHVQRNLERARETGQYAQALQVHLREILPASNGRVPLGETVHLLADPRDQALLETLLREEGLDVPVEYTLAGLGGLILIANQENLSEGSTRTVNTLESRLERALPYLRRGLAAIFEEHIQRANNPVAAEKEQAA